jgi:hypothetical protein
MRHLPKCPEHKEESLTPIGITIQSPKFKESGYGTSADYCKKTGLFYDADKKELISEEEFAFKYVTEDWKVKDINISDLEITLHKI